MERPAGDWRANRLDQVVQRIIFGHPAALFQYLRRPHNRREEKHNLDQIADDRRNVAEPRAQDAERDTDPNAV
ncbi:hypothetical protein D3C85_1731110 [compost metagenome]